MVLETKYNIGDKVQFRSYTKLVHVGTIVQVQAKAKTLVTGQTITEVSYRVNTGNAARKVQESEILSTL